MTSHTDSTTDDFFHEILGFPGFSGSDTGLVGPTAGLIGSVQAPMMLQLGSGDGCSHMSAVDTIGLGGNGIPGFPLGLSLDQGKVGYLDGADPLECSKQFRDDLGECRNAAMKNAFPCQPISKTVVSAPNAPPIRPRVRARRGQATDPHSIAERLRRERIAERIRALQELVPTVNKTDRATMLDEIVDYVKFLRLQVKVLSMSRLGGAGAVAPLVTDMPLSVKEEATGTGEMQQRAWDKWSNESTEHQVAKLMEENVGAAMQFLQSKALCLMPISLASAIYHPQQPDPLAVAKPQPSTPLTLREA